jgi:4-hydroxythreonine-4-phosphate dehydrogenase
MTKDFVNLAITTGEPAGIGPEISVRAAHQFVHIHNDVSIQMFGDKGLLKSFGAEFFHPQINYSHIPLASPNVLGELNPKNAPYVLQTLDQAYISCTNKTVDAMVTAPVQKSVINDFGFPFTGHTEYLADKTQCDVVMMLCGEVGLPLQNQQIVTMRVALATTHLPLQKVSQAITSENLVKTLEIIQKSFKKYFGMSHPRIQVSGLNPHAGEGGYLGREEIEIIIPALGTAKAKGIDVKGPYPADTMFRLNQLDQLDVYLAMYHDQGLIPLKMACFGTGVNITLGLPIIRTSVDHGTALEIAGKNLADHQSMFQALQYAYQMAKHGSSST